MKQAWKLQHGREVSFGGKQGKAILQGRMQARVLEQQSGVGLQAMRERLHHLGGTLRIDSTEHGLTVAAVVGAPMRRSVAS